MAGHVFVSYSRGDGEYVRSLVEYLQSAGLEVWTDDGIDYGDRWMEAIRERIDTCGAFIPVMTPSAEASAWVEREIIRADEMGKPILPVLLSGKPFFQLSHLQYDDVSRSEMPSRRYLDRLGKVLGSDAPLVVPSPPRQPPPSVPPRIYVPQPYTRSRRTWPAIWRALRPLIVGDPWMRTSRRVTLAATRIALLAVLVVGITTLARHADSPALGHLWWLSGLGAAAVACAGAAYKGEWMFSTSVAVVVAARWAVIRTSIPEEVANLVMALVLGILVVGDRSRNQPRATLFRRFAVVASIVVAISWAFRSSPEEYAWWPALLDQLRWFLPVIVTLAQLSWEDDLDARRVSGAMVATFGGIFAAWAVLSMNGADSTLAETTTYWLLNLACGLVLLTGGATALRYRRYAY